MDTWHKYLTQAIALNSRAKNLESELKFKHLFNKELMPSQIVDKLRIAHEAMRLYKMAQRACNLLIDAGVSMAKADIEHIATQVDSSIRRMGDIIKILNSKAQKWGVQDKQELIPSPKQDAAQADDMAEIDPDALKAEIKHSLRSLSNIIDYMEVSTLLKIRRELDK